MTENLGDSFSELSLQSLDSASEDWDRSFILSEFDVSSTDKTRERAFAENTPRSSIAFPSDTGLTPGMQSKLGCKSDSGGQMKGKRSLEELMKLHAEKGTQCRFSAEEASRVADVLGEWINASSSPYEVDDDFFARSKDDLSVLSKRSPVVDSRQRGQSEGANSRPPSSTGFASTS